MKAKLWTLPPFAPVLGAMGYVWSRYDALPTRYPVHWGLSGADRFVDKSPGTVLMPGLVGLLVLAMMAFKVWRLEKMEPDPAGRVWWQTALVWIVGVLAAVVVLLPLMGETDRGL